MARLTDAEIEELRVIFAESALDKMAPTRVQRRSAQMRDLIREIQATRRERAISGGAQ